MCLLCAWPGVLPAVGVCDAPLTVSHCDHVGSWIDFTLRDRPVAALLREGGDGRRSRVPSAGPLGARDEKSPHQTNGGQLQLGWSRAPAALNASAKETRHRVTVCPSGRVSVLPASPYPPIPSYRDPQRHAHKGDQSNEVSVRKGTKDSQAPASLPPCISPAPTSGRINSRASTLSAEPPPGFYSQAQPDWYYPVVCFVLLRRITGDPSICPPTYPLSHPHQPSSVIQSQLTNPSTNPVNPVLDSPPHQPCGRSASKCLGSSHPPCPPPASQPARPAIPAPSS